MNKPFACTRLLLTVAAAASLLLTSCAKEGGTEEWRYFGKLYAILYSSDGTVMSVCQIQGSKCTPLTNTKLAMDIEAAAQKTKDSRSAGSGSVGFLGAAQRSENSGSAAVALTPSVSVYFLDVANLLIKFDPIARQNIATLNLFGSNYQGSVHGMDITPDAKYAVIGARNDPPNIPYAMLVDLTTFQIVSKILLPSGIVPNAVAITPDGAYAYVASFPVDNSPDGSVQVIDINNRSLLTSIPIVGDATLDQIVLTPDGTMAFLASDFSYNGFMYAIDTTTNTLAYKVSSQGGPGPVHMAMHPDGSRVYLAPFDGKNTRVFNIASGTFGSGIPGPGNGGIQPIGTPGVSGTQPVFTPDGRYLYILDTPHSFSAIDTASDTVVVTFPAPVAGVNGGRSRMTYFVLPD